MEYIKRVLQINEILKESSMFLFGPRMTGKTALIENEINPEDTILSISFLNDETLIAFQQNPILLRSMLKGKKDGVAIIDEVQLFPTILKDVQHIIGHSDIHFLLTGSSYRRLRKNQSNFLGGRAGIISLHPFVWPEIKHTEPTLEKIFESGLLPKFFLSENCSILERNYVQGYLKEEIGNESLVRNLSAFSNFLVFASSENTEILNFSNISRDIGISADSIKGWYQILVDTFLGYYLDPYRKGSKRIPVNTSKFYFFDVGIARVAARMPVPADTMTEFGKLFENYIFTELRAFIDYNLLDDELFFWRTRDGYEVDFVIDGKVAIEVKTTKNITNKDLKGLREFKKENAVKNYIVVTREVFERTTDDGIKIIPWKIFLDKLWTREIL